MIGIPQIVFALTVKNHLWRSDDGGITWEDQTVASKVLQSDAFLWSLSAIQSADFFKDSVPTPPLSATSFCLAWTPWEHFWFLAKRLIDVLYWAVVKMEGQLEAAVLSCLLCLNLRLK
jgi:hypothetical protein